MNACISHGQAASTYPDLVAVTFFTTFFTFFPKAWAFPPVAFHSTENNNAAYSTTSWHTMNTGFAA
jgi:hypothetical protein